MNVIYRLNFANGDFYVGQTAHLSARLAHHEQQKGKGSPRLAQAWNTSKFLGHTILEQNCENINAREIYWINKLKPTLNVLPGGEAMRGLNHPRSKYTEEQILQVLSCFLYSSRSYQDIAHLTNVPISTVRDVCFLRSHAWATQDISNSEILEAQKRRDKTYTLYSADNIQWVFSSATEFEKTHELPPGTVYRITHSRYDSHPSGWTKDPKQSIVLQAPDGEILHFDSLQDAKKFLQYNDVPAASITRLLKQHRQSRGWQVIHKSL